ncbi:hypothetical protein HPB47_017346 [Ixodes persulcatus]|uniref:Uncharacterized protein n=1 Tax=Ixodes persulcatus TaxID=34615 RepID=A0AC60QNJ2_IXOPE|nr:hypothetical protein HPB47_017346 [Ixodes persulcatus]
MAALKRKLRMDFTKGKVIQNTLVPDLRLTDPKAYRELLQMDESTFEELLGHVRPLIEKEDAKMRKAIKHQTRLELTLRFLAKESEEPGLPVQTGPRHVHAALWETCAAICTALGNLVHTPAIENEWLSKAEDFKMLWQFPNCVASIDGKHVQIVKPAKSGILYYNYKKTFSLVLFALTDARYNFIYDDASYYGSASDGGVWARTPLGKQMASGNAHLTRSMALPNSPLQLPPVIVGDDAFPLAEHLLKTHSKSNLTDEEATFNERLSRFRRVVENSFGQLDNRRHAYYTTSSSVVQAPPQNTSNKPKMTSKLLPLGSCGIRYGATAAFIRNVLTDYFSTVGALP